MKINDTEYRKKKIAGMPVGVSIYWIPEYEEYCVIPDEDAKRKDDSRAYYTDDLSDAESTARFIARRTNQMASRLA